MDKVKQVVSDGDFRAQSKFIVSYTKELRDELEVVACRLNTNMNAVFVEAIRQYLDVQKSKELLSVEGAVGDEDGCSMSVEQLQLQIFVANERIEKLERSLRDVRVICEFLQSALSENGRIKNIDQVLVGIKALTTI